MKARAKPGAIVASKGGLAGYAGEKLPFVGWVDRNGAHPAVCRNGDKARERRSGSARRTSGADRVCSVLRRKPRVWRPGSPMASPPFLVSVMELAELLDRTAVKQGGIRLLEKLSTSRHQTGQDAVSQPASWRAVAPTTWLQHGEAERQKAFVVKGLRGLAEGSRSTSRCVCRKSCGGELRSGNRPRWRVTGHWAIRSQPLSIPDERSAPLRRLANAVVDSFHRKRFERTGCAARSPAAKWLSSKVSLTHRSSSKAKLISRAVQIGTARQS